MTTSWRSRLDRADEHLEEVEREVDRFLGTNPYRVVGKLEPHPFIAKMVNYTVRGYVDRMPDPRFGHVIGDVIENLRSCLDHIAYELASHAAPAANGTEFPVFWNPAHYGAIKKDGTPARGSGLFKVRSMTVDAQTAVEGLQPYQGVDSADFVTAGPGVVPELVLRHPLFLIHDLRRINFHHEPHVTGAIAANVGIGFNQIQDLDMLFNPSWAGLQVGTFNNGAKLSMIQFTIVGPDPVVQVNALPTFDVAFEPEGPARGQPVVATLRRLRDHVEHVIFPKLEPLV